MGELKKVLARCVFGALSSIMIMLLIAVRSARRRHSWRARSASCRRWKGWPESRGSAVFHNLLFLDFPIEMVYNVGSK